LPDELRRALFADPVGGLPERLSKIWPELSVVRIESPVSALAVRFGSDRFVPSDEDIPAPISRSVMELSAENATARFMLLRTECWGGLCANWGQIFQDGRTAFKAEGDGALHRLIAYWGVDLGPSGIFEPLRRDFRWHY
jgi:hypothetical protein